MRAQNHSPSPTQLARLPSKRQHRKPRTNRNRSRCPQGNTHASNVAAILTTKSGIYSHRGRNSRRNWRTPFIFQVAPATVSVVHWPKDITILNRTGVQQPCRATPQGGYTSTPVRECFKCQLHTTHVGAVGWELYGSSTTTCAGKADHGFVICVPLALSLSFENSELNCSTA